MSKYRVTRHNQLSSISSNLTFMLYFVSKVSRQQQQIIGRTLLIKQFVEEAGTINNSKLTNYYTLDSMLVWVHSRQLLVLHSR